MPVTLKAMIQTIPEPDAKSHQGLHVDYREASGDDYDTARTNLDDSVPEGWRLIWIMRA